MIQGGSRADELRRSAEAVDVVDTRGAQARPLSVGDVLARTQGVGVQRTGGLGSDTTLSLNGLYDRQITLFLDGVPLDIAGYPQGIANVPISLVERLEIYRGVVPIRFGAEALGGAINLVTTPDFYGNTATVALERGSFGLYRGSATLRAFHPPSGFTVQAIAYADRAHNDYRVLADVPDARGRNTRAEVTRFHDGFGARGASVEAGVVDRPWARRLLLRASFHSYDKEVQNNIIQTVPYGEVEQREKIYGLSARYEQPGLLGRGTDVEAIVATSRRQIGFDDASPYVYDWYGRRVVERAVPGETDTVPHDTTISETSWFARAVLGYAPSPRHRLRLAGTARSTGRHGNDPLNEAPNKVELAAARTSLVTAVGGLEYTADLLGDRLENIVSVKTYAFHSTYEEPVRGGDYRPAVEGSDLLVGYSEALRYRLNETLTAKASYERTTRFPHPDELFGNGALIRANADLKPERSDNGNLGVTVKLRLPRVLTATVGVDGFARLTDRQILIQSFGPGFQYQNLLSARTLGFDAYLQASLFQGLVVLSGNFTTQDMRNTSDSGSFGQFQGQRLPNRPARFGNASAALQFKGLLAPDTVLSVGGDVRYVESFLVGWASQGDPSTKLQVPDQVVLGTQVSWAFGAETRFSSTLQVQNLTDTRVYDFFGVQRPGRSVYLKLTATL